MVWFALAGSALSFIGAAGQQAAANAQARINTKVSKANAENANLVREQQNRFRVEQGHTARWLQSVNNNRHLDNSGHALEAAVVNYRRQGDLRVNQRFSESIREAEAMGAAAAAQAASGVTGAVADAVTGSMALRDSIVRQQQRDFVKMADYDQRVRTAAIMSQMVGGLDQSLVFDSLDYGVDVGQEYATSSASTAGFMASVPGLLTAAKNIPGAKKAPAKAPVNVAQGLVPGSSASGIKFSFAGTDNPIGRL